MAKLTVDGADVLQNLNQAVLVDVALNHQMLPDKVHLRHLFS